MGAERFDMKMDNNDLSNFERKIGDGSMEMEDAGFGFDCVPAEQYMVTETGLKRVDNKSREEHPKTPMDKLVLSAVEKTAGKELEALLDAFAQPFGLQKGANAVAGVLRYILVRLAKGCSPDEATTPLSGNGICPVSADILTSYAKCVAQKCFTKEIDAVKDLIDRSRTNNFGDYMERRDFFMCGNGDDDEYDDNDPINGWLCCAKAKELHEAIELSQREKDKDKEALLLQQDIALLKEEAAKNNPLAIFYLGVIYWRNWVERREQHDCRRAVAYLTTAEMMGVQRASNFLAMMQ